MSTPKRKKLVASKTTGSHSSSTPTRNLFPTETVAEVVAETVAADTIAETAQPSVSVPPKKTETPAATASAQRKSASPSLPVVESLPLVASTSTGVVVEREEEDAYWEVDKVVGWKKQKGKVYFKIRWVGCSEEDDTWEPESNLCDSALKDAHEYEAAEILRKRKAKKHKTDKKKATSKSSKKDETKDDDNEEKTAATDETNDNDNEVTTVAAGVDAAAADTPAVSNVAKLTGEATLEK